MIKFLICLLHLVALSLQAVAQVAAGGELKPSTVSMRDLKVEEFGAKCDGVTDDYSAIRKALDMMIKNKIPLSFPPGVCLISRDIILDMAPVSTIGFTMQGAGSHMSVLRFINGSHFQLIGSKGDAFYPKIVDLGFQGKRKGPVVEIGSLNFSDPVNRPNFRISVQNLEKSGSCVGLMMNHVSNGNFDIETNCGSGGYVGGLGKALLLRQVIQSNFIGVAASAGSAVSIEDGYTYGNVFSAFDMENVSFDVVQTSEHAGNNTFIGGNYVFSENAIQSTSGGRIMIVSPNINPSGHAVAEDFVSPKGYKNVLITGRPVGFRTPDLPSSGATIINASGRDCEVVWSGATSKLQVGAVGSTLVDGTRFIVQAGESVKVFYSGPARWHWKQL